MRGNAPSQPLGGSRKANLIGPLCFNAALLLTLWAVLANNITVVPDLDRSVVLQAIACSLLALALIAICWKRMPTFVRFIAAGVLLVDALTLVDAGGRRLPAILGW